MNSGVLYIIFTGGFVLVTFAFAFHYWEHRRYRLAFGWFVAMAVCLGAGAFFYYLSSTPSIATTPFPKGKAYVIVGDAKLEPLTKDQSIILTIVLENTGTVEAIGYLKDMTCSFKDVEPRSLTYIVSGAPVNFKLVPSEKLAIRLPFETVLDDWRLKMLNENRAELYFYARGDYRDETGTKYELSFCRQYTMFFPSHLAICDENITFKEPEPVNQ